MEGEIIKKQFSIKGMHCSGCANSIEQALKKTTGVKDTSVNFVTEKATIEFDISNLKLEIEDFYQRLKEAVESVGYELVVPEEEKETAKAVERVKGTELLSLKVLGMDSSHCAAIVAQAIKTLSGIKKVEVDYNNARAKVIYEASKTTVEAIQRVITDAGYKPIIEGGEKQELEDRQKKELEKEVLLLKKKLIIGAILSTFVFIGTYTSWSYWLLFLLTIPVQFWVGAQFYRGLVLLVKYKTADMNTLIAIGTLAAFFYSTAATFFPGFFERGGLAADVYFDTSTIIITLILLGRFLELRAKGQASEAIKKLMGLQPKEATVLLKEEDERIKN